MDPILEVYQLIVRTINEEVLGFYENAGYDHVSWY